MLVKKHHAGEKNGMWVQSNWSYFYVGMPSQCTPVLYARGHNPLHTVLFCLRVKLVAVLVMKQLPPNSLHKQICALRQKVGEIDPLNSLSLRISHTPA